MPYVKACQACLDNFARVKLNNLGFDLVRQLDMA